MLFVKYFRARVWLLFGLLWALSAAPAPAQGFFGFYPASTPPPLTLPMTAWAIDTTPEGGFHLTCINDPLSIRWQFYTAADGTLLGYDSIVLNLIDYYPFGQPSWLPDENILLSAPVPGQAHKKRIRRQTDDGAVLWESEIVFSDSVVSGIAVRGSLLSDSFLVVHGNYHAFVGGDMLLRNYFARFDAVSGQLIWQFMLPLNPGEQVQEGGPIFTLPTADGGFITDFYVGVPGNGFGEERRLMKVNADGSIAWIEVVPVASPLSFSDAATLTTSGNFVGAYKGIFPPAARLLQYSANGDVLYDVDVAALLGTGTIEFHVLAPDQTGGVVLLLRAGAEFYVLRFDAAGNLLWKRPYAIVPQHVLFSTAIPLAGAGFAFGGRYYTDSEQPAAVILRIDSLGAVYPNAVVGTAAKDLWPDCHLWPSEILTPPHLAQWPVALDHQGQSYYTNTDSAGHFLVNDLQTGDFSLRLIPPSYLWQPCPPVLDTLMPDTVNYTMTLNVPVQTLADCPLMTVEAGAAFFRRCTYNAYQVRYCNAGTAAADNVVVTVVLDPAMVVSSASRPYTESGDTLQFAIGAVEPLDCGEITLTLLPDCDSTATGQTVCLSVHVSPDSLCLTPPNWSGATIVAAAECQGDSIRFTLHNAGTGPSTTGLEFIVVDDHVIMRQGLLPSLAPGEEHVETMLADGGTWRIISEQEPNHPAPELPSIGVEGCGAAPGEGSLGYLLDFANRDGDPFSENSCEELLDPVPPGLQPHTGASFSGLRAEPRGVGPGHRIEPGVPLRYKLVFQHAGADTLATVVLRDTLPAGLDPATVRPGASSHGYSWTLSANGVVTFTLADLVLSGGDEPASYGFVDFEVAQKPGLEPGTVLENRAGFYFGADDEPALVASIWHTVDENFLEVTTKSGEVPAEEKSLLIYPNPAAEAAFVAVPTTGFNSGTCRLYDAFGREVGSYAVWGAEFRLERRGLPSGLYLLVVEKNGKAVAQGKVAWK